MTEKGLRFREKSWSPDEVQLKKHTETEMKKYGTLINLPTDDCQSSAESSKDDKPNYKDLERKNEKLKSYLEIALYEQKRIEEKYENLKKALVRGERARASYIKLCLIIRNKIDSLTNVVYDPGMPRFTIRPKHLKKFQNYNLRNEEKRRIKLLFALQNHNPKIHQDIAYLKSLYSQRNISDETIAFYLSKGFFKLSAIIKPISQEVADEGILSDHLTDDPWINYVLSLLNNLIDRRVEEIEKGKDTASNNYE